MALLEDIKGKMKKPGLKIPTGQELKQKLGDTAGKIKQGGQQLAGKGNVAKDLNEIPLEHVINLRNQGLSNNQIIQNLQREGYTIDKINNAINQANIKQGVVATPFQMQQNPGAPAGAPSGAPPPMGGAPPMGAPPAMGGGMAPMGMPTSLPETNEERLQEIAEAIIDEKWQHMAANIDRVIEWKEQAETRITQMEQQMKDLKEGFDRLHEGVLGKISDYDKSMTNIGTEIKALEKVFQKILPGFMENVNELSRITKKMKTAPK